MNLKVSLLFTRPEDPHLPSTEVTVQTLLSQGCPTWGHWHPPPMPPRAFSNIVPDEADSSPVSLLAYLSKFIIYLFSCRTASNNYLREYLLEINSLGTTKNGVCFPPATECLSDQAWNLGSANFPSGQWRCPRHLWISSSNIRCQLLAFFSGGSVFSHWEPASLFWDVFTGSPTALDSFIISVTIPSPSFCSLEPHLNGPFPMLLSFNITPFWGGGGCPSPCVLENSSAWLALLPDDPCPAHPLLWLAKSIFFLISVGKYFLSQDM